MGLAAIDIVFIGVILLFALHSCVKGFVSEVMSLVAVVMGVLSAVVFFKQGALFVRDSYMPETKVIPEVLSFVVIFLAVFIIIKVLQMMLKNIIEGIHLGALDRVLGFLFGIAEGLIIVCLLLFLLNIQPFVDTDRVLEGSFFSELLLPFVMGIRKEAGNLIAPVVECKKGGSVCV